MIPPRCHPTGIRTAIGLLGMMLALGCAARAHGEEPSVLPLTEEVPRLVAELNHDRYTVRQRAAERLKALADDTQQRAELAEMLQRAMLDPATPFEVRVVLEPLIGELPEARLEMEKVTPEEVVRLIDQLDANQYATRQGAAARLLWLAGQPRLACTVMVALKQRMADATMSAEAWRHMQPAYDLARGQWLLSDPQEWQLPEVSPEQIEGWIDDLSGPAEQQTASGTWTPQSKAYAELLDLLARDEYLPRVTQSLERRLEQPNLNAAAADRIHELLAWNQPAMVAEFWQAGHHRGIQHLLIGVPNHSFGAQRPSHFDYCDDQRAHCVSGNALSPGDYPVGVAFMHPNQETAQFHLVNLPTPRRRMAYEYQAQRDEAERLAELTSRTAKWLLEQQRLLTVAELAMLRYLDPPTVSRLAVELMRTYDDSYDLAGAPGDDPPSHHSIVCFVLAQVGTQEAIPGLLEQIEADRILPPNDTLPYRLKWIAPLAIARRDPWPKVDQWLADQIHSDDLLAVENEQGATLGATAAAILLERHDAAATAFGLEPVKDGELEEAQCPGYRFAAADARQNVLQWWAQQKRHLAAR